MTRAWRPRRRARLHAVPPAVVERRTALRGREIHSFTAGATGRSQPDGPLVVVLPGLGLPGYTLPTARAVASRGIECTVLDLPGFGDRRGRSVRPNIHAVGMAGAGWVEAEAEGRPVVLLGHSTGSQAALTAALALQDRHDRLALVLAGPTFAPSQRRLPRLALATPFAYRDDGPAELVAADLWRGRTGIPAMLASGLRDAPEERIAHLAVPLSLTAGVDDAFAPFDWLDTLAAAAAAAPSVRTSLLGGSHNNLFTHPGDLAGLVGLAVADLGVHRVRHRGVG